MDKQKDAKKEDSNAFSQLSNILFNTKQTQQKFLELAINTPKYAINKELGSGNMSYFKGLYAMKLAVIMNTHQLYQQNKHSSHTLTSSDTLKKPKTISKEQEKELQSIESFIQLLHHKIINESHTNTLPLFEDNNALLNSLSIDPEILTIDDIRTDISNAIDLSFKDASCFKLLLWINTLLQINSKNTSNHTLSNPYTIDTVALNTNLLSFLQQLSPFTKLYPPSEKFVSAEFEIDSWDNNSET